MEWTYTHLLLPILNVLYIPCDWILGWSEHFPPIVSISIFLTGSAVPLVFPPSTSSSKMAGGREASISPSALATWSVGSKPPPRLPPILIGFRDGQPARFP